MGSEMCIRDSLIFVARSASIVITTPPVVYGSVASVCCAAVRSRRTGRSQSRSTTRRLVPYGMAAMSINTRCTRVGAVAARPFRMLLFWALPGVTLFVCLLHVLCLSLVFVSATLTISVLLPLVFFFRYLFVMDHPFSPSFVVPNYVVVRIALHQCECVPGVQRASVSFA